MIIKTENKDIEMEEINIQDNIEAAPPILYLNNEEKFTDLDGNIVDIETRGERNKNKIYFNVPDVSKAFNMHKLHDTLIDKRVDIGKDTDIGNNVIIKQGVHIGKNCKIGSNVMIENALLGDNIVIKSGTLIGQTGFGFAFEKMKRIKI